MSWRSSALSRLPKALQDTTHTSPPTSGHHGTTTPRVSQKHISPQNVSGASWFGVSEATGGVRLLGYTRISTASQDAQLQLDALASVGVERRDVFSDVTSGSKTAAQRPGMRRLLDYATSGDTVVVWRVDRLGRSLIDVLNTVNLLSQSGIAVRSVQDGIDPATTRTADAQHARHSGGVRT